jgi:hypothetical protein
VVYLRRTLGLRREHLAGGTAVTFNVLASAVAVVVQRTLPEQLTPAPRLAAGVLVVGIGLVSYLLALRFQRVPWMVQLERRLLGRVGG